MIDCMKAIALEKKTILPPSIVYLISRDLHREWKARPSDG
jgi:hypothetical protein